MALTRPHDVVHDFNEMVGQLTFNEKDRRARFSSAEFARWEKLQLERAPLTPDIANAYAKALKDWALERGADNWAHLWHPLGINCRTGSLTRKFVRFQGEQSIFELRGKDLLHGETDGSSFPTGGLRTTSRAAGYLSFDYTSNPYILGDTVYLPCVFTTFEGDAIDEKSPLLRSIDAMCRSGTRLMALLGLETTGVFPEVGIEQEYFLIPYQLYEKRPDLILTGRTLLGSTANKGQQFSDHYMGNVRSNVLQCLAEFEAEMWKRGITINTRHTEVAPAQFEFSPVFCRSNQAFEDNMVMMRVLQDVAASHGLVALLHEKPFAGVNGSGKHNNFSFSTAEGVNLLNPGKTPQENVRFMVGLAAFIRGVDIHSSLLRASIAVPGNDHRLGGCEAPPGIISIYTGDELYDHLKKVIEGGPLAGFGEEAVLLDTGVQHVDRIPRPNDDRNRTSPLPYGGNRVEFRAVGSSQSVAIVQAFLTTIVADSFEFIADGIEELVSKGSSVDQAIEEVVREILKKHERIIFNGNGYSEEWLVESAKRGLPNITTSADAIKSMVNPQNIELLERTGVLRENEFLARQEVLFEHLGLSLDLEAKTLLDISTRIVVPASTAQQERIAQAIIKAKAAGVPEEALSSQVRLLTTISTEINALIDANEKVDLALDEFDAKSSSAEEAVFFAKDVLVPATVAIRQHADKLENLVDPDLWKLPSYEQMIQNVDL